MRGVLLILCRIHVTLTVLDTHAYGKGLLLHSHACAIEHFKGIAGAVTRCNNKLAGGKVLAAAVRLHSDTLQCAIFDLDALQTVAKTDIRA